jgi:beta-lactam-binding protein with PASTA domain
LFKFITHKSFFTNFLAVIVLILLLLFIFFGSLDFLTRHNKVQHVPYVVGQNLDAATKLLEANGFVVAVKDSVYIDTSAPLAVVRQSPDADAVVKIHRTVYLTINRAVAPLVEMPDLRGFSVKSAQLYLQSLGLRMGDTIYKPDIAKNAVKEQKLNGKDIAPGTEINMGSAIDLVIGSGLGDQAINVPDLTGMTLADASI